MPVWRVSSRCREESVARAYSHVRVRIPATSTSTTQPFLAGLRASIDPSNEPISLSVREKRSLKTICRPIASSAAWNVWSVVSMSANHSSMRSVPLMRMLLRRVRSVWLTDDDLPSLSVSAAPSTL